MATAKELLAVAEAEIGYDRYKDPETGSKYGRWYEAEVDKDPKNYDYGANGVAYCAMFASWVLNKAEVECAGFPSAYCPYIHNHQHLKAKELEAGDVVLFDWGKDGTDDHVGFVVSNDGKGTIQTIEGNVSSGKVLRKTRSYDTVCGGIRPKFDIAGQSGTKTKRPAFGPGTYKVAATSLNIRKKASTITGRVVGSYKYGATVVVSKTKVNFAGNTWGKTSKGWIAMRFKGNVYVSSVR